MMECLTNIVGVTKDDCPCLIGGLDSEAKIQVLKSTSGLYLDDLPGGITLRALNNIDSCKDVADMGIKSIQNAGKSLEERLLVELAMMHKKAAPNFIGMIGQMSYANTMNIEKRWSGVVFRGKANSDSVMNLTRFIFILNKTGLVPFKIIKAYQGAVMGEEVYSANIQASANNYVTHDLTETLAFPLSDGSRALDYFFLYDSEAVTGIQPKDNKIDCNCSPQVTANINQYIKPMGVQLDSLEALNINSLDDRSHGILIDVQLKCSNAKLICGQYNGNEAIAVVMAYCVLFKAGELLIEEIQKSPEVNRYTTMNREYLWGKRNHFRKEFEDRIPFLASAIDVTSSTCYVCNEMMGKTFIHATDGPSGSSLNFYDSASMPGIQATINAAGGSITNTSEEL